MKKKCQKVAKRALALVGKKSFQKGLALAILSFIAILLAVSLYYLLNTKKIYANQYIGDTKVSGLTKAEAKDILTEKANTFLAGQVVLKYEDKEYSFLPNEIGLNYDLEKTTDEVWRVGRRENFFKSFWEVFHSLFKSRRRPFVFSYDSAALLAKINKIKSELEDPPKDYEIVYSDSEFQLLEERKDGRIVDEDDLLSSLQSKIGLLLSRDLEINLISIKPEVSKDEAEKTLSMANGILSEGSIKVLFKNQAFDTDSDTIAGFLGFSLDNDKINLNILDDRISLYVDSIGKAIDVEPVNATLAYANNKLTVVTSSKNGQRLNKIQARLDLKSILQSRSVKEKVGSLVTLQVETILPEIADSDIERLGIKELVGSGTTNFLGSPANRIHNITVGAKKLNNIILKPGQEFSTIGQLGEIDAAAGYLPELVIKEDRTTPEFGGGLCQVSSTLFRAVLNAGLKVTERKSHKYRVSYYEPPVGMDATIYSPSPDLKFVNNYDNYLLIQSKVEGKKITYEIFGSKDGRTIAISEPVTSDFIDPGPTIYVETDTLNVGEQKRIEKKAIGLTARFNYEVKRGEDILQSKTFTSKYIPWPEKWLVGTKPVEVTVENPPIVEQTVVTEQTSQ